MQRDCQISPTIVFLVSSLSILFLGGGDGNKEILGWNGSGCLSKFT